MLEAIAKDLGYALADLVGIAGKSSRASAAPKHRHSENASLTSSGCERKPLWIVEALHARKTPEDMAIG